MISRVVTFIFLFSLAFPANVISADTNLDTLDKLLSAVKKSSREEGSINKQREQRFLKKKQSRAQLLSEAKQELKKEKNKSAVLQRKFDSNEKRITVLEDRLRQRSGSLGELMGVVKQVSGDAVGVFKSSIISAQITDRGFDVAEISSRKVLPSISQLEQLWFAIQQEMTESGKMVTFRTSVVSPDGTNNERDVTRIGSFNVISDGKFLRYSEGNSKLVELSRQPDSGYTDMAQDYQASTGGRADMMIDPTRGNLLARLVTTPSLIERVGQGKVIGYAIVVLTIAGLILVAVRFVALMRIEKNIKLQIGSKNADDGNPLGRILGVYLKNTKIQLETLERKLDEAILKEVPGIQRGLPVVKILAVIAPMLGLLGTVSGMIETFQSIALFGSGDPRMMAGGISQALVTTVLGLVAAIPLLFFHSLMSTKARRCISVLEEQSAGLVARHAEQGMNP
jgi:biopolymer transport protein ExbB